SQLRKRYDYIILDSTPYFPVADSSIVNKCVDATLFVVRCDYTSLKLLREIDVAAHDRINPIRNLNIVINDFNRRARKYRYGYGDGYGCKSGMEYGYGYGYGYGEKEARKRG
ncbi:MAG: chromosome partitioning protein ParA, partial [Bacteroidales bacterium]|nr:chromosome partitioning protein ParA [Bacteroidales bacterium]